MNEATPKISVIVPVYKAEAYLRRCVDSILAQTFQDFEVLLIDDGSPDRSDEICDEYARKDSRVRVFHKKNGGAAAARKIGVYESIGDWIMFVDSDDTIPCHAMEELFNLQDKADIICGNVNFSNNLIFKYQKQGLISNIDYIKSLLLDEVYIGPCAKLIKRNLFVMKEWDVDKEIKQNEDLLMLVTLSLYAKSIYIDQNIICYNYWQRPNTTSSLRPSADIWFKLFSLLENKLSKVFPVVPNALYVYELRRIYSFIFLAGISVNYNSAEMIAIKNKCSKIELSPKNRYMLYVLFNKHLRYIDYYLHKFKHAVSLMRLRVQ